MINEMIDSFVILLFDKYDALCVFSFLGIGFFLTTILPAIEKEWLLPGIEKRYSSKGSYDLEPILKQAHLYPTAQLSRYIAYQCLGLSKRFRVVPGDLSEWLVKIEYDIKQAPFFEKFFCVFTLFFYLFFLLIILSLASILIYFFITHLNLLFHRMVDAMKSVVSDLHGMK